MAEVDPKYEQLLQTLRDHGKALVAEVLEGKYETLHRLFGYEGVFPVSPTGQFADLDRQALDDRLIQLFGSDELTLADSQSLHAQAGLLASLEKALRARHRRRLTNLVYGASRSWGHTHEQGMLNGVLRRLPVAEAG